MKPMNDVKSVIDWLTYRSYESNRMRNPHIPYYKWRKIYADAAIYEEIFNENLKNIYPGVFYDSV